MLVVDRHSIKNNTKIIYIASYLTNDRDLHKNVQLSPNQYDYIRNYSSSIHKNNLSSIIFVDHDTVFENDDNIIFYKVHQYTINVLKHILLHDKRFAYYYDVINKIDDDDDNKFYVLTDLSDVIILNPLETIMSLNNHTIYIGSENDMIDNNKWFGDFMRDMYWICEYGIIQDDMMNNLFDNKRLLNCGIIAGSKMIMLNFLSYMLKLMHRLYSIYYSKHRNNIIRPLDMFLVNYVAYKYFSQNIYSGNSLNTRFGHYEYDMSKAIKHK
jgi:hypothetical protein